MSLKEQLRTDSITQLKAGNKMELTTLRNVLGEIETREKSGKTPTELNDAEVEALIRKQVANRHETAKTYTDKGIADRAAAEMAEAAFLEGYLPQALSDDEARSIVDSVMAELSAERELTMKDMGSAMKLINAQVAGRYDGKTLSTLVRAKLA
ncbi:GatB/YqeY domain-containing protein [Glutamicibacter sp.]|uniref:GatB/YqeY domain-containing protein n=1 Tax=Glutamicibacter sp. TaxID=1931995 RepID=UPI002B48BC0E|nr:GatB/YqeY domain-containing protein [Glutamicibacter sp.]HJX77950.1 GatB/YqeY domain-containing protein [Glutamicibacter sp.]